MISKLSMDLCRELCVTENDQRSEFGVMRFKGGGRLQSLTLASCFHVDITKRKKLPWEFEIKLPEQS